jgi:hypothetical protein
MLTSKTKKLVGIRGVSLRETFCFKKFKGNHLNTQTDFFNAMVANYCCNLFMRLCFFPSRMYSHLSISKTHIFSHVSSEITCKYHNLHMSSCSCTVILFILPLKVHLIEIPKRKATVSRVFYIDFHFHRRVNLNHVITNDTFWKSPITIHDIGNFPLQFLLSLVGAILYA